MLSLALPCAAHASGTFTALETPNVTLTKLSANGAFAAGSSFAPAGFRWTASTGAEELIPELDFAMGINNDGTIAGAVPENGGVSGGGRDLGAFIKVGGSPIQLTETLQTNSNGYDVSDDGTVVGLSFGDNFVGPAVAFAWTEADGMVALPVNRPDNYSRANQISSDGRTIVGWNDQDDGFRTAVVWVDRVPIDIVDGDGLAVGEADGVSANGAYVVGGGYTDIGGNSGSWLWRAETGGVEFIPGMTFAFGVSNDGNTVVGNTGFFDDPPRAAMIWRKGHGTALLADYLAEQGIAVPDGWDLSGGLTAISADAHTLGGWGFGPLGTQSYIVRIDRPNAIFANGFED
ncbi:MAG TPA: hypothetical protein VKB52_01375 [Rhodanobacteraceae bacterium]|nr:hypothetical protein [Rhodanobacteraceae bacterium]